MRKIKYNEAILEALDISLSKDSNVYLMGLGVPDKDGVFGTTVGLKEKYGDHRVMDMPISENAMTGVVIGSSLVGMRPIMVHQRLDFFFLAFDQLINNAAKWHYMFGSKKSVPIVIRLIIGRGWGQGPQHCQSILSFFGHIPGLKVVVPSNAYDAKGLLIASVKDDNPVIFIEHRWLHFTSSEVPIESFTVPIGKARIVKEGKDITLVALSYNVLEAMKAAKKLKELYDIDLEIIDIRTIRPLDEKTLIASVSKTKRLIVADQGWKYFGFGSEIIATVCENVRLKNHPIRLNFPEAPGPTSWALSNYYYLKEEDIIKAALKVMSKNPLDLITSILNKSIKPLDQPSKEYLGPF